MTTSRASFLSRIDNERGAVAILAAVLLLLLVGIAAFVIDIGWLFVVRGELQNAADAGALSGVVELVRVGPSAGENSGITYATEPSQFHLTNPAPAADGVVVTVLGPETLQVQVRRVSGTTAGAVPTIFARIWGTETVDVDALAVATMDRCIIGAGPGNLIPFAINQDWLEARDTDGDGTADGIHNAYPKDMSLSQFGIVDFDGGENSQEEIVDWIRYSYDGTLVLEEGCDCIYMEADPGISGGSMDRVIDWRIANNPLVLIPVFTEVIVGETIDPITGLPEADQTIYKVVDFVAGLLVSSRLTGNSASRELMIDFDTNYSAINLITGDCSAGNSSVLKNLNATVSKPVLIR